MNKLADTIATWPQPAQDAANAISALIRDEAQRAGVGPLTETLKWGDPAFLTQTTRAGTTLRLAWKPKSPDVLHILVHCQTTLIDQWRGRFAHLDFDGNRALLLPLADDLPEGDLRICIRDALTYHRAGR